MSDLTQFWQERFERYGHTGWFDAKIYAFDQQVRIDFKHMKCPRCARLFDPTGSRFSSAQ